MDSTLKLPGFLTSDPQARWTTTPDKPPFHFFTTKRTKNTKIGDPITTERPLPKAGELEKAEN